MPGHQRCSKHVQANPTPSRGWKPPCSPPRVRFCAVTTPPLMEDGESPGRNGCAEMTVRQHVAVRAKLVRTASTRFPRFGRAKSWQNASKCPQKPAGRRCAAWRGPARRVGAMPRSADTSNLIVAFGSATVFTSTLTLGANQGRTRIFKGPNSGHAILHLLAKIAASCPKYVENNL